VNDVELLNPGFKISGTKHVLLGVRFYCPTCGAFDNMLAPYKIKDDGTYYSERLCCKQYKATEAVIWAVAANNQLYETFKEKNEIKQKYGNLIAILLAIVFSFFAVLMNRYQE